MACDPRVRPHPTRLLRRARWIRFGAAGLVCMMLGACTNPVDSPRARAGTCQVGVVGDSLTVGAQSQGSLEPQLAAAGCTHQHLGRPFKPRARCRPADRRKNVVLRLETECVRIT